MPGKILIVDDSRTVILMEQMILTRAGYDVVVARDGAEAVEKARAEQPDAILLDVVMPQMDGFAACAALRADEATKDIPVIFVTTKGDATHVETGYVSGGNDYVTKPIDTNELLAKVKNVVGA